MSGVRVVVGSIALLVVTHGARAAPRCPDRALEVRGGAFTIGTPPSDDDAPLHPLTRVRLSRDFCLDRTEVTVADFARCADAGRCEARVPAFAGDRMPMTNVRWSDARDACSYFGGRLPTEVEWERAARGDDRRGNPWGWDRPTCAVAKFWTELWGGCGDYGPSVVGTHREGASPFGIQDLAGNVVEWIADAYIPDAYARFVDESAVDPIVDLAYVRARVVRGGGWAYDVVHSMHAAERDGYPADTSDPTLGFRCAFDLAPTSSAPSAPTTARTP
ncbi:MAG: formylglycine-generating enzyme family protein [Polyangiales bacterium]